MTNKKLAVIGGGASAALLLGHLADYDSAKDITVDIYDRTGRFARGVAYSTEHDCHLLNVRVSNMSAYQEDKEHFAEWAALQGYGPLDFVPRKKYGEYLQSVLSNARQIINTELIEDDVLSSQKSGRHYAIETASHGIKKYDHVVLASGNVRPLHPKVDGVVSSYYDDPWCADFKKILAAKEVALIGSGLTAVDMVLALHAKGYAGKILIFSRNSLLPAPHVMPVPFQPFLNKDEERQSPLQLLRLIRHTVQNADVPWQSVIDSLRASTNTIWQNWSETERRQFSRRLMTFWNIHRHRMAPEIAEIVKRLHNDRQLVLVKSGVNSISSGAGAVVNTKTGAYPVGAVINCLGYRYDESGRDFEVSHRIGPANFGTLFETTAIPEIRAQAYAITQKIAQ